MAEDSIDLKFDTRALEKALSDLPAKLAKQYMQQAMEAGGKVMQEALVAHTPERTDEVTPDGTSLPPGILKADMQVQVIVTGQSNPKVRVGPTEIGGNVARWQNNGWMLTGHGKSKASRKRIKEVGKNKNFISTAFDEAAEAAVDTILSTLAEALGMGGGTTTDDD